MLQQEPLAGLLAYHLLTKVKQQWTLPKTRHCQTLLEQSHPVWLFLPQLGGQQGD